MAVAIVVTDEWFDGKRHLVQGTLTFSGSYSSGGDTLDFGAGGVQTASPPSSLRIQLQNGDLAVAVLGTDQTNSKVKVFTASETELAASAYPSSLTTGAAAFQATFPQLR